jgi:hypothetical protein
MLPKVWPAIVKIYKIHNISLKTPRKIHECVTNYKKISHCTKFTKILTYYQKFLILHKNSKLLAAKSNPNIKPPSSHSSPSIFNPAKESAVTGLLSDIA